MAFFTDRPTALADQALALVNMGQGVPAIEITSRTVDQAQASDVNITNAVLIPPQTIPMNKQMFVDDLLLSRGYPSLYQIQVAALNKKGHFALLRSNQSGKSTVIDVIMMFAIHRARQAAGDRTKHIRAIKIVNMWEGVDMSVEKWNGWPEAIAHETTAASNHGWGNTPGKPQLTANMLASANNSDIAITTIGKLYHWLGLETGSEPAIDVSHVEVISIDDAFDLVKDPKVAAIVAALPKTCRIICSSAIVNDTEFLSSLLALFGGFDLLEVGTTQTDAILLKHIWQHVNAKKTDPDRDEKVFRVMAAKMDIDIAAGKKVRAIMLTRHLVEEFGHYLERERPDLAFCLAHGDYEKFTHPGRQAAITGFLNGGANVLITTAKWCADYMLRCHSVHIYPAPKEF